jgi:predicted kinase
MFSRTSSQGASGGAILIALGGLPGTGKTSIARRLSSELGAVYLRIDTIEQALLIAGPGTTEIGPAGYLVGYSIAADNLKLGRAVVADSVNSLTVTRSAWNGVASEAEAQLLQIEIICSDKDEHRRRIEHRKADIVGHTVPTWEQVTRREYEFWHSVDMVIDTSAVTVDLAVESIMRRLVHPEL